MGRQFKILRLGGYILGASLLAVGIACSSSPTATPIPPKPVATAVPTPTSAPLPTPTPSPRYGGIFIGVTAGDPSTLDVYKARSTQFFNVLGNAYTHLVQYNWQHPVDEIIPDLAESWTVSADLQTYSFKIRHGVTWHDGKAFTSQDAKWAIEKMKASSPRIKPELQTVESVTAPDSHSLVIKLSKPRGSLLNVLGLFSAPVYAQHIYEAHDGDLKAGPNIGTGPFKDMNKYKTGISIELERNPAYYEKGLPYLDGIKALIMRDDATRKAAFRAGQVHMIGWGGSSVNKIELDELRRSVPDLIPNGHSKMAAGIMWPNGNIKPWSDPRVRLAAHLAIDRWQVLKVLENTTEPAGPVVPPNWALADDVLHALPGYAKTGPAKDAERAEARRLLAEAGYPDGYDGEMTTVAPVGRLVKLQVYLVDQLQHVGIRLESIPRAYPEWAQLRSDQTFDTIAVEANTAYPDPDAAAANIYPGPFSNIEDAKMVALFQSQMIETDPVKRKELVNQLQMRMLEVLHQIPIAWTGDFYPTPPTVRNWTMPLGVWSRHRLDHVWLAE